MSDTPNTENQDIFSVRPTPNSRRHRSSSHQRSAELMAQADALLDEIGNPERARQADAATERTFPGVSEDEKTLSGRYEPALHNYPEGKIVNFSPIGDIDNTTVYDPTVPNEAWKIPLFPFGTRHQRRGTGLNPEQLELLRQDENQYFISDRDRDTPNYGTERNEREYAGFDSNTNRAVPYLIDSPEYWREVDNHKRTLSAQAFVNSRRVISSAGPRTSTRSPRSSRGPRLPRGEGPAVGPSYYVANRFIQGKYARTPPVNMRSIPVDVDGMETSYLAEPGDANLYSYNTKIASRHATDSEYPNREFGTPVFKVSTHRWSNTTSRQQRDLRNQLYSNEYQSPSDDASEVLWRARNLDRYSQKPGRRLGRKDYELGLDEDTFVKSPNEVKTKARQLAQEKLDEKYAKQEAREDVARRQPIRNKKTKSRNLERAGQLILPLEPWRESPREPYKTRPEEENKQIMIYPISSGKRMSIEEINEKSRQYQQDRRELYHQNRATRERNQSNDWAEWNQARPQQTRNYGRLFRTRENDTMADYDG